MPIRAVWPTHPSVPWIPESLSLRVKWSGHKADHSSPPNAKIKNILLIQEQLYLYLTLLGIQTARTVPSNIFAVPTMLWTGRTWLLIPVGAKDISLLRNVQTSSRAHPIFYWMGNGVPSQG